MVSKVKMVKGQHLPAWLLAVHGRLSGIGVGAELLAVLPP